MSANPIADIGVDAEVAQALQQQLDHLNEAEPVDVDAQVFLANPRHPCRKSRLSGAEGRPVSAPLELKEVYVPYTDGAHALIYKQGSCRKCGVTARSKRGRVVLIAQRPPTYGRVARD